MELFEASEDPDEIVFPDALYDFTIRFCFKDGSYQDAHIGRMHQKKAFETFNDISRVVASAKTGTIPGSFSLN